MKDRQDRWQSTLTLPSLLPPLPLNSSFPPPFSPLSHTKPDSEDSESLIRALNLRKRQRVCV